MKRGELTAALFFGLAREQGELFWLLNRVNRKVDIKIWPVEVMFVQKLNVMDA
jgi:hypothetical protein